MHAVALTILATIALYCIAGACQDRKPFDHSQAAWTTLFVYIGMLLMIFGMFLSDLRHENADPSPTPQVVVVTPTVGQEEK